MTVSQSYPVETFSNEQLDAQGLPTLAALALTDISPRYRIVNISLALFITVLLCAVVVVLRLQPFFSMM